MLVGPHIRCSLLTSGLQHQLFHIQPCFSQPFSNTFCGFQAVLIGKFFYLVNHWYSVIPMVFRKVKIAKGFDASQDASQITDETEATQDVLRSILFWYKWLSSSSKHQPQAYNLCRGRLRY